MNSILSVTNDDPKTPNTDVFLWQGWGRENDPRQTSTDVRSTNNASGSIVASLKKLFHNKKVA